MDNFIKFAIATIFTVIFAMPVAVHAKRVDSDKAKKLAQNFVESKRGSWAKADIRLKHTAKKRKQKQEETARYYVFSVNEAQGGGFVIVAGDDAVKPVLGYSDNGNYDENNLPPNFAYWMDFLEEQIAWAQEQGLEQSETVQQEWEAVSPLIKTQWNQSAPYNNMAPIWNGSPSYTGCVATAMAQIMKYYNHPAQGSGSSQAYTTTTLGISIPSVNFSETSYDWYSMQNTYSSSTASTPENDAVATLMYHAGVSVKMNYSPNSSGAPSSNVVTALKTYFGYDESIQQKQRQSYNDADWEAMLMQQVNVGMPVYYSGSNSASGHAFILDGYDNTGKFHFNWGWGGRYNGYFVTTALNPGTGGVGAGSGTYNQEQAVIINIIPKNAPAPIIEHPSNQTVQAGEKAQFTVVAESNGALAYQWQVSINSGPFSNVSDGTGGTTATYTTPITTKAMDGYRYRCITYQWQLSTINTIVVADTIGREDFEGDNSSFILVNDYETNKWVVGTATAHGGSKSAYISNDGSSNAYTTTSPSIVHIYRDVTFSVFEACTLWFYFKGKADANNYLSIRLVETSVTPTAGSVLGGGYSRYSSSDSWGWSYYVIPPENSGTTKRLVFTWRNNDSGGANPPIALDDMAIVAKVTKSVEIPFSSASDGMGGISNIATLTVKKVTPAADILTYDISPATYNGKQQRISVAAAQGVVGLGTITVKYNGSTTVPTNVGTYAVTVDVAEGTNFVAASGIALGEYKIIPKPVTITGVTATNRAYNGTTTVALTGGTLVGVASGDNVGFTLGTGTVAIPDVGSNKAVTTNITLTGIDASNYTLTQPANVTVNITDKTPILSHRENPLIGRIGVQTTSNAILLENLPSNAKVEVYNLQGKCIYSSHPENPKILRIGVQTKGMYIIKIGTQTIRAVVR